VSKASLWEIIGLENITLPEAICLVSFVIVPMVYVSLVNPAQLGYAFITLAGPAYIIAVLISSRRENQYNAP
jgi:hypothetical protein